MIDVKQMIYEAIKEASQSQQVNEEKRYNSNQHCIKP